MKTQLMSVGFVTVAMCTLVYAQAPALPVKLEIESQPLDKALSAWAEQTGYQVLIQEERGGDAEAAPIVKGTYTPEGALKVLLASTDLKYKFVNARTVAIRVADSATSSEAHNASERSGEQAAPERVAPDARGGSPGAELQSDGNAHESSGRGKLAEVIVTAQKRTERLQDVPVSIAVVSADDIRERGLVSEEDYLRGIPGVNQVGDVEGPIVVIRGLETSPASENFSSGTTVATYFGETPTTNSAGLAGNANIDLKLVDVERVEVLRGPQGTAFGNSSLGGAVRTIPIDPKLDQFEGKVDASYSNTSGTGGDNNMVQVVGNIPIIDNKLAVRISAYQFDDSGFYRNVAGSDSGFLAKATSYAAQAYVANASDVGSDKFTGGRVAALFQASDDLKVTVSYLTQKTEVDGQSIANSGTYEQEVLQVAPQQIFRGQKGGVLDTNIDLASTTLDYNLGWATLLATYSHIDSATQTATPFSIVPLALYPASSLNASWHREHSGEVRLTTKLDGAWNFLAGLYAEELKDQLYENFFWYGDSALDIFAPNSVSLGDYIDRRTLKQQAAFGEVSWEFLPRFRLTGGIRAYNYKRSVEINTEGALFGLTSTPTAATASGTTGRANLSFKPDENSLIYAGWSQGFRLGKPQPGLPAAVCDPNGTGFVDGTSLSIASTKVVNSDSVNSYELGAKFMLLAQRLSIDADVFRIDWTGVPVRESATCAQNLTYAYTANAGAAKSQGVELQAKFYMTQAIRADFGGSWIDAKLTENALGLTPPAYAGDRLPGSPKMNANIGLQYEFNISGYKAFIRADSVYVGTFYGDLLQSADTEAGGYVKADASARVTIKNLDVDFFVHNLTNADDFAFRGTTVNGPFFGYRLRPRTIGIQMGYSFQQRVAP